MANTRWTWAQALALVPDNGAGGISAQDLRDGMYTLLPVHASMYISTSASTTIGGATTWTKAAGTTTNIFLDGFTMPANNQLKYTGTPDRKCLVSVALSSSAAAANKTFEYGIYYYDDSGAAGAMVGHSTVSRYHSSGDIGAIAVHADITLSTDDYVELHVQNTTDATNIDIDYMQFRVLGFAV